MIQIKNINKKFGKLEVLKDINLSINKGEIVTILGPSGSGKSTLLRCINLLEQPNKGQIIFKGNNILDKKSNINEVRKNIGMVFQNNSTTYTPFMSFTELVLLLLQQIHLFYFL